jgi:hypothetical protein
MSTKETIVMIDPKPFCLNPGGIKAFVLGCDPTAFDKNGELLEFEYVFDLGKDQRYFSSVLKNLNLIGLSLEDIYVQNLNTTYQDKETGKNKSWEAEANKHLAARKTEFDTIDQTGQIPVFLTAERLYSFLLKDGEKKWKASELYALKTEVPIPPAANKLGRPLIPLYRHYRYNLMKWPEYLKNAKVIF